MTNSLQDFYKNALSEKNKANKKNIKEYGIQIKKILHTTLAGAFIFGGATGHIGCSSNNKWEELKTEIPKINSSNEHNTLLNIFPNKRQPEITEHIIKNQSHLILLKKEEDIPNSFIDMKIHSDKFYLHDIKYPQVHPDLEKILIELSDRFNSLLKEEYHYSGSTVKITLTSLTRTEEYNQELKNASKDSSHQYGIAADIRINDTQDGEEDNRFAIENGPGNNSDNDIFMFTLATILHKMQTEGKIIVMTEITPPHIHMNLAYGYTNDSINKIGYTQIEALKNNIENGSETNNKTSENIETKIIEPSKIQNSLQQKPIDLQYQEKFPEQPINLIIFPKVSHTEMIQSRISPSSKIIRCMRRKPITDAAEDKYEIPKGLLMAMMAQEGAGDPTLPNVKNRNSTDGKNYKITKSDGGLGLLHIQGANAEDFGLKVLQTNPGEQNSREMIDIQLGDKIIQAYYANKMDLKKLSEIDERWHPVEAIDCAARFLKSKYNPKNGKDAWIKALEGYSGRKWADKDSYPQRVLDYRVAIDHYLNKGKKSSIPTFSKGVNEYIKKTQQAGLGKQVEETAKSIEVEIGGVKGGYDFYLDYHAKQCENYELSKYINHQTKK